MRAWAHSPCPLLFYIIMVVIEQLRISPDCQKLFIDAHINKASYFEDVMLGNISIDTQDTVLQTFDGPSDTPVFIYPNTSNIDSLNSTDNIDIEQAGLNSKEVHLVIDKNAINADLSKDILYVYFSTIGIPSSNTPCRLDETHTLGVTFNESTIYNRMMSYTKEIINTCEVPKGFIDMILQLEAVKVSLETGNYASANKFYNRLINTKSYTGTSNINCRCHG